MTDTEKKIYVVGVFMDPDMEDGDTPRDEDFKNYAYRDYEEAKKAFAIATKSMVGFAIPLDDLLKDLGPLTKGGNEVGVQDGYKAVRFQAFDHMPHLDIEDKPIAPDFFREEENVDDDGKEGT